MRSTGVNLPSGTVTFLFTDIENSTPLWEIHPEAMKSALTNHDSILKEAVESNNGQIIKTTGDGIHAVFSTAQNAIKASLVAQRELQTSEAPTNGENSEVPLRVRMGLHTGECQEREGDYYGAEVNRAARIMSVGHGGQILLSETTVQIVREHLLADMSLLDLGEHRLKGISKPERIFQLCHPDLVNEFPMLKSLAAFKHNLTRQLSSFIGREKELAEVKRLLKESQLLTLLGPGGTGKTRLMLQAAEEVIEDYPDGVWLVELAPLTDPDLIPERIAAALNMQEQPGRQMLDTLTEYLRPKELLLLLDNVEHIVHKSAEFTKYLLEQCFKLNILVTGREALFIDGETTIQVPSLSIPDEEQTFENIAKSEGVQLFLERARSVRPDFEITEQNAATIAEIVYRLDGIPLALELAAARVRMLTVEKIAARLNDRFRLLTGGRRTALPRQQTLEALIDWSWQLLDQKEHILLRRLSVFSGGWSLEAAEQICAFDPLDELDVFDLLNQLINKSLVTVQYLDGEPCYGMLESIRQFGQIKLFEASEGETLRDHHTDYFVAFARESEYHLTRETMLQRVKRILLEMDNLRAVLAWTFEDHPELALDISSSLLYHWAHWIHPSEARTWLETSIEKTRNLFKTEPSKTLVQDFIKAHIGLGVVISLFGENDASIAILEEGIALAREHNQLEYMTFGIAWKTNIMLVNQYRISPEWEQEVDRALEMSEQHGFENSAGLLSLGKFYLHANRKEFATAMAYFQRANQMASMLNNPRVNANMLQIKARLSAMQGDVETAKNYLLEAIEDFRAINDYRNILHSRSDLAHLYRRTGNIQEALALYRETIGRWQEEGSLPALAHQLECFAYIAISQTKMEHAARLLGKAKHTRASLNAFSTDPMEVGELEQAMAKLTEVLGEEERDRVMVEGAQMSLDDAVTLALKETA